MWPLHASVSVPAIISGLRWAGEQMVSKGSEGVERKGKWRRWRWIMVATISERA